MAGRRGGRGLDPDTALAIRINGTALRLTDDDVPVLDAIAQLRELAGDRPEFLAIEAGNMIGGYLGTPLNNPNALRAAHLLVLATSGHDHEALVAAADRSRKAAGGSAYSL
jgi:hypothetical protein